MWEGALADISVLSETWLRVLGIQTLYSLVLAALVMVVLRAFRVRSPAALEAAWGLVLLRLVLPPGWSASFSARSLLDSALEVVVGDTALVGGEEVRLTVEAADATTGFVWLAWPLPVVLFWSLGVAAVAGMLLRSLWRYRCFARRAREVTDPALLAVVERWRRQFRIRRKVRLVSSRDCLSPFTTGLFRPVVFLPEDLFGWSRTAAEAAIAHELAHVRRWDELWIVLTNLVRAVFFFNPAAWLAANRLAQARERACDSQALTAGGLSAREYGRGLLGVLRLNVFGTPESDVLVGLVDRKEDVHMRLMSIASGEYRRRNRVAWVLTATVACGMLLLPMGRPGGVVIAGEETLDIIGDVDGDPLYRYIVGGEVTEPKKIDGQAPKYTEDARSTNTEGTVVLRLVIRSDGTVTDAEVLEGLPFGLAEAAVDAVKTWRFEPSTLDGEPVAVSYIITVRFNLEGDWVKGDREPANLTDFKPEPKVAMTGVLTRENRIPPGLLDMIVDQLPDGVVLTEMMVRGDYLSLRGWTGSPQGGAELVAALDAVPEFSDVNLEDFRRRNDGEYRFNITASLTE